MTSNKTFQRLLSVLLFACMLLSLMPGFALAEAEIEGEPAAEAAVVEETAEAVEETAEAVEEEVVEAVVVAEPEPAAEVDTAALDDIAEPMARIRVDFYANWPVDWPGHTSDLLDVQSSGFKGLVGGTYSSSGSSDYALFCKNITNREGLSTGYTLTGWDTERKAPNAEGPKYSLDFTTTDTLTLYAHWEAKGNVTYKDGAYGQLWDTYVIENVPAGSATPKLVYNEVEGDPTTVVLDGVTYTFQGWNPTWSATMGTGNVTYTATWSPKIPAPRHNDPSLHDTWQSSLTSWLTNLKFTTKYIGSNGVERSFETVAFSSFNSDKAYSYSEVYGNDYDGYWVDVTVFFNDRIEAYVSSEVERVGGLSGYVIDKDKHPVLPLGDEEYPSLTFTLYAIFYSNGETYDDGTLKFKWWPFAPGALSADFSIENQSTLSSQGAGNRVIWMTKEPEYFTVTYTDDKGILPDQPFEGVLSGEATPAYDWEAAGVDPAIAEGMPVEDGDWYVVFAGWTPEVASTVTGDCTYTAVWEDACRVTFTAGVEDENAFEDIVIPVKRGETLESTESEEFWELYGRLLDGVIQLSDGHFFIGWDHELEEEITEDVTFTAQWDWFVDVYYLDGFEYNDKENPYSISDGQLAEYKDFLVPEDPVREGYSFVKWISVVDEEADGYFVDETTGWTINYIDESWQEDGETFTSRYCHVLLEAQWKNDTAIKAYGGGLSLEGDIGIKFYLVIPDEVFEDPDAYVTLNEKTIPISEGASETVNDITMYVFKYRVAAKEMNKDVELRAYNGSGEPYTLLRYSNNADITADGYHYTVQKYVSAVLKHESSYPAKLVELVKAMSDYGSKAQIQFNYEVGTAKPIYNADAIAAVTLADLTPYKRVKITTDRTGISFTQVNLTLNSETTTRLFFEVNEGSIEDYSFTVNGNAATPRLSEYGYAVEIPNVAAKDLDTQYTVEVSDSQGVCLTVKCRALSYAYLVVENADTQPEALVELVKALYLYNQAANAYFGA